MTRKFIKCQKWDDKIRTYHFKHFLDAMSKRKTEKYKILNLWACHKRQN